jgi:hypothetical protein
MPIQTILNQVEKFKSFVYGKPRMEKHGGDLGLVVEIEPRKNSRPFCSGCGRRGRTYDRLEQWRFEFVPIWGSWSSWRTECDAWTASGVW